MAVKFIYTFAASTVTALVAGVIFYTLSAGKSVSLMAYTTNDTYMGTTFVFLLALIIGLSVWSGLLEKRAKKA